MSDTTDDFTISRPPMRVCPVQPPWIVAGRVDADLRDFVCGWLAEGRTLRSLTRLANAPTAGMLMRWGKLDPDFGAEMLEAVEIGRMAMLEEIVEIADHRDALDDKDIEHRKLQISARLDVLQRLDPVKFGGKNNTGGGGGDVTVTVVTGVPEPEQVKTVPAQQPRLSLDG